MPKKKKRLDLNKVTIVRLEQEKVKGGALSRYSGCCTILMTTCIPSPEDCWPGDTIPAGGNNCL